MIRVIVLPTALLAMVCGVGDIRHGRGGALRVAKVDVPEGHGELQQQREQRHRCRSPTLRPEPTHLRENPTGPCGEQQGGRRQKCNIITFIPVKGAFGEKLLTVQIIVPVTVKAIPGLH